MHNDSLHIFSWAPVGLLSFEAKGDKLELPDTWFCRAANSAARNLFGSLSPDGLTLRALFPESVADSLSDILLTNPATSKVDFYVSELGTWLLASGNRVDGRLTVALTDITKQKQLERNTAEQIAVLQALLESEAKYRSIFEDSMDVIYLLDAEGRFTDINDSAMQMLGFSKAEFLEKKITDLFEDEEAKSVFLQKLALKENMRDFETEILASNGERRFYIIACTCYQPSGNVKNYFQGILHDITRRKKAEQELLIAEKLGATGRLVRMLGHEIRNPLSNIDLAINQLTTSNDELTDYIEIIQRNSKRISQLLTDLLQISTPSHLDFKPCALNELLDMTLEMAADRIALKNISVEKTYDPNTPTINADADKLRIALLNIVLNAVEIMEEKKGILKIETVCDAAGCAISINDNGPGIAREHINHIFEPYFTRKPQGLGLGLSSTLNIVQAHRGRMEVESEVGKGATFLVWLPV